MHLSSRDAREFGISSIEIAPHASHRSRNHLPFAKLAPWSILDDTGGLNSEHSGELHTRRVSLPGEHLGATNTERLYPNQYLTKPGRRDRKILDL